MKAKKIITCVLAALSRTAGSDRAECGMMGQEIKNSAYFSKNTPRI